MIQQKLPFTFLATIALLLGSQTKAQLYINSATLFIQPGATVSVQGNVTSNVDIQGAGTVVLNGSANQSVDMGGKTIQNLQVNNAANATLASGVIIGKSLTFTSGKITLGANNLTLVDTATTSGQGAGKFLETNSTGQVIKNVSKNIAAVEIPVGSGTTYRPAFITTTGTYSAANVGIKVSAVADPSRPPMISDYLLAYWPVTQTGITGTLTVTGQYGGAGDISGTASNLKGYFYNGTDWSSANGTNTTGSNQVATKVTGSGDVYGMDGFIVLKAKAFLQGAYNSTTGVMSDNLRTLASFPLTDPYRNAPYSTAFARVNDNTAETINASVLTTQVNTNNNIVDWVFLELRNTTVSPGNTVLQTRSALLQKDGDIVDVDGVSPVTFNNVPAGSYTIAVRHRNHLGISANPATNLKSLTEQQSVATALDFTTATSTQIYGTGSYGTSTDSKNILWAGNGNLNANTRFIGLSNDKDALLAALSNNSAASISTTYNQYDLNMNGKVSYIGLSNDKDFLLTTILSNNSSGLKTQALPN